MKIALAQINSKIGDFRRNVGKIIEYINRAKEQGADLVVFPEMTILGYPPRDLLDLGYVVEDNLKQLEKLKPYTQDIGVIVGYVDTNPNTFGKRYYNAAALIYNGEIVFTHFKQLLPFYDVFDETRYFEAGKDIRTIEFKGKKLGITICEDIWNDKDYWKRPLYGNNPINDLMKHNPDIIINISASPYWLNKQKDRLAILQNIAKIIKKPLIYVNQVGGNDDLIFDGISFVIDENSELKARGSDFKEELIIYDTETKQGSINPISESEEESILKALVLGLKDYCEKVGFKKVVLGLSGGIDSALTAVIAVQALGKENVLGITMPSMYSSTGSVSDSEKIAENLGIDLKNIPIKQIFDSFVKNVQEDYLYLDLAEENLQARIRANILMTYSNREGRLLLSTGNKSELSVGYCTLYGDMAGGLAVLSDVPKTMVYRLSRYINREKEIIPEDTITKPPSAELRPDQTDQDSLPPYDILDAILKEYVEQGKKPDSIAQKYGEALTYDLIKKINQNEYKRRQAALGLKVTSKAFGFGRRFPIVQGYNFTYTEKNS